MHCVCVRQNFTLMLEAVRQPMLSGINILWSNKSLKVNNVESATCGDYNMGNYNHCAIEQWATSIVAFPNDTYSDAVTSYF